MNEIITTDEENIKTKGTAFAKQNVYLGRAILTDIFD